LIATLGGARGADWDLGGGGSDEKFEGVVLHPINRTNPAVISKVLNIMNALAGRKTDKKLTRKSAREFERTIIKPENPRGVEPSIKFF
jgi:hypothetical protein